MTIKYLVVFLWLITPLSIFCQKTSLLENYTCFYEPPITYNLKWTFKKGKVKSGEFKGNHSLAFLEVLKVDIDTIKGTLTFQGEREPKGFVAFAMDSLLLLDVFDLALQKRLFTFTFLSGTQAQLSKEIQEKFNPDIPLKLNPALIGKWACQGFFNPKAPNILEDMKQPDMSIHIEFKPDGTMETENFWFLKKKEHKRNGIHFRSDSNLLFFKITMTDLNFLLYKAAYMEVEGDMLIISKEEGESAFFKKIN